MQCRDEAKISIFSFMPEAHIIEISCIPTGNSKVTVIRRTIKPHLQALAIVS